MVEPFVSLRSQAILNRDHFLLKSNANPPGPVINRVHAEGPDPVGVLLLLLERRDSSGLWLLARETFEHI